MNLFKIFCVWHKFQLGEIVRTFFPNSGFWFLKGSWFRREPKLSGPERLCQALEALGPIYIKFGQLISTRRDLLPETFIEALSRLQDRVTPFDGKKAKAKVEAALGGSVEDFFESFDEKPLAAASIAQVHPAVLKDGRSVVVKILRPEIRKTLEKDIRSLYFLARWLPRFYRGFKRFRLNDVVAEIETTLMNEIDLLSEAGSASALRRAFSGHSAGRHVVIPEVFFEWTRSEVMVSERIFGTPISDLSTLKEKGVDLGHLARVAVEVFYAQIFDFSFFHADLHPGNVFVDASDPLNPKFQLVDFGIVGSLSAEDQHYLAANFLAFFERDYRKVAKLHIDSGWIPAKTRVDAFESAMRAVSEPVFGRALKDISLGVTMGQLFRIAKKFEMEVQPQLLLLQKTLLNIEALGRLLDPELDLWGSCKPFFKTWMKRQIGWKGLWRRLKSEAPLMSERLPELPGKIYRSLSYLESLSLRSLDKKEPSVFKAKILPFALGIGVGVIGIMVWMY